MFTNKIAFVTGGGSGIGAEVARGLAGQGAAAVVVADVNAAAARAVASGLPAGRPRRCSPTAGASRPGLACAPSSGYSY